MSTVLLKKFQRTQPPLGDLEDKIEALVLCFSESPFDYEANHQGLYLDVCGVNPLWHPYLEEQDIPINSIQAGYAVYQFYLEQTGDRNKALKKFKGIQSKSNNWIIKKVRRVTREVKQLHLKD